MLAQEPQQLPPSKHTIIWAVFIPMCKGIEYMKG